MTISNSCHGTWRGNDFTYCASENCQNKCGRKLMTSLDFKQHMDKIDPGWNTRIWYAYFCDEDEEAMTKKTETRKLREIKQIEIEQSENKMFITNLSDKTFRVTITSMDGEALDEGDYSVFIAGGRWSLNLCPDN